MVQKNKKDAKNLEEIYSDDYFRKISQEFSLSFNNLDLLKQALTHRSFLNENPQWKKIGNNERLEFLGDAVLGFLTARYLYQKMPELKEGDMTFLKSSLTSAKALLEVARALNLQKYVLVSKGEKVKIGNNYSLLSDAVEALIGAIFLDQGLEKANEFLERNIFIKIEKILSEHSYRDAKSVLQEITQAKYKVLPTYYLEKSWGPPHDRKFKVAVYLNNKLLAKGEGRSLKEAEIKAAQKALKKIGQ